MTAKPTEMVQYCSGGKHNRPDWILGLANSSTDSTSTDKCALPKYFSYLEFPNECYSKYVDEFLMTIVQLHYDYQICNALLF